MAYLLVTNPDTFKIVKDNNIILFHGTNSNALYGILNNGINTVSDLKRKDISVSTGEKWSRINGERNFISFTDDLNVALDYASIFPSTDLQNQSSFAVIIGLSLNDIKELHTNTVISDLPEIGVTDNIPVELIKFLAVPTSKIEFVRKLVDNTQINVMPIDISERFYYIDDFLGSITINSDQFQKVIDGEKSPSSQKTFDSNEVQSLASTRRKSGILNFVKTFVNRSNQKGRDNKRDAR